MYQEMGQAWASDFNGFGGARSLTLDFSQPVAAFGATFVHFQNTADDPFVLLLL